MSASDPGLALDRRSLKIAPGSAAEIEHRLGPGGTLSALVETTGTLGVRRDADSEMIPVADPPRGTSPGVTVVRGLPVGNWELCARPEQYGSPMVVGRFTIRAGETTYVDTLAGADVVFTGRVTRGGAPVEGAWVSALGLGARPTGPDGRFEFRARLATTMFAQASVRPPEADGLEVTPLLGCMAQGQTIRQDFEIPPGELTVRATALDGSPASGAEVTLAEGVPEPVSRTADGGGAVRWTGVPAGTYRVVVRFEASEATSATMVVVAHEPVAGVVAERPSGAARVRVADEAGFAVFGAVVEAGAQGASGTTDVRGEALLRGLPVGTIRVLARYRPTGAEERMAAPVEARVEAGKTVDVELGLARRQREEPK